MAASRFALFATAVGECALAWNDVGLTGVWLPGPRPGDLKRQLERRAPAPIESAPSESITAVIASIQRLLDGVPVDLRPVALDWSVVPDVARRVYEIAREVSPGRVVTYGAIARRMGDVDARGVGQALGANPFPIVVPCHRVIAADGKLGGFSAPGGTLLKQRILAIEQARPDGPPGLFDAPDPALDAAAARALDLSPPEASVPAAALTRSLPAR